MNVAHWLSRMAREYGDEPAVFWGKDQCSTYEKLQETVGQISTWLQGLGIEPGDHVAILWQTTLTTFGFCLLYGILERLQCR